MSNSVINNPNSPQATHTKLGQWVKQNAKVIVGGVCICLICHCVFKALGLTASAKFSFAVGVSAASVGAVGFTAALAIFALTACILSTFKNRNRVA